MSPRTVERETVFTKYVGIYYLVFSSSHGTTHSSIDELKAKISETFGKISNEMRHNVWSELERRLHFLQANNGEHLGDRRRNHGKIGLTKLRKKL
jgi:hypothetical protein